MKTLSLAQFQTTGSGFINELKNIVITFIAARLVINGQISLGEMVSVQYIIAQLNVPISNVITFIQSGQDAKLSLERLSEIHNKKNEDLESIRELRDDLDIIIDNFSFSYDGKSEHNVISNLHCRAEKGKITAIVGESGSGKTTLLKLLLKFYLETNGSISIGNDKLQKINTDFWRSNCGVVMQDGYIFADSILRNITESESADYINKKKLIDACKIANISDFIESLPVVIKQN